MSRITVHCSSADDTARLARCIVGILRAGDCVVLTGDLGAGKTTFVKSAVAALGIDEAVTSPTFTLVHRYGDERRSVVHADLYRLERTGELDDLDLDEAREDGAILFVEWGDLVGDALGDALLLSFALDDSDADGTTDTGTDTMSDTRRLVSVSSRGERWRGRWDKVVAALRAEFNGDTVDGNTVDG
jgi:tRNA threonylcarbamoyladenosine biosynthesis protein TsaE